MKSHFLAPIGVILFLWIAWIADAAAHGHYGWVMDNPVTAHCCGPQDCKPVAPQAVRYLRGRWSVNGKLVPDGNVHLSGAPDARYHACFYDPPAMTEPRCLFIPGMS